jgi:prepilin-type N-terminal cleavage/methylation domain-containing protein/prepilin-type processing-associated H-X9-DG protein
MCVRRSRAFTLVELLVVIGIIAVLVGLLLPALNASRAQSRSVKCMNNIRQITMAVGAYADANGTRLPWNYFKGPDGQITWNGISFLMTTKVFHASIVNDVYTSDALLCPADDSGVDAFFANTQTVSARFRNGIYRPVLVSYGACPRLLGIPDPQVPSNTPNTGTTATTETWRVRTHYMLNGVHPAYEWPGGQQIAFPNITQLPNWLPTDRRPQLKITQVRMPTETWMVFENANSDIVAGNPVFRHPHLSANFGYVDGHVENLRTTAIDAGIFRGYTVIGNDKRTNLLRKK